jgi:hypothetical protein
MSDASGGKQRLERTTNPMNTDLFYPAPPGLPVPVNPPRGSSGTLQRLRNWDAKKVQGVQAPELIIAGALWLHGFLDESHAISQGNSSAEGSYWHALMHRSEPDFSNSKYWYRRVGKHAIFPALREAVAKMDVQDAEAVQVMKSLLAGPDWDPFRFVDLVEQAARGQFGDAALIQQIAAAEYHLLMAYCLGK